jgi:hypothetical protein
MAASTNRKGVLDEKNMIRLAWLNLWMSLAGMPLTLWLTSEPPFILALSWYAVTVTALGHISAARANQEIVDVKADTADVEAQKARVSAGQVDVQRKETP